MNGKIRTSSVIGGARNFGRRDLLKSAGGFGAFAAVQGILPGSARAASPKSGGHLRVGTGFGSTTDSLDPATTEHGMTININYTYANNLMEVGNDGSLVNELAEQHETEDGKTWYFRLRKGVEFHNGKTLTPDDVVASFEHHIRDGSRSAAKGLLSSVESVRRDGKDGVVFELSEPNADFAFLTSDFHLVILPSEDGMIDATGGVGTGAYKLDRFDPGVRAEFSRNPNYWKEGRGHFDSVTIFSLVDVTARQNAVLNGDVDVIDRVDPKTVSIMSRAPNLSILEVTGTQHYTFPMRLDSSPFDNLDMRLAMKYAINRQEMLDKILLGHGVLGNDHPIAVANAYHADDLEQRSYDPDRARHHFEKSGHAGPVQLHVSDAAFAGAVDAAQLLSASASAAGIEIEVVREPTDGYWSNVWNKKPWCACYWGGRPTEDWMFSTAYTADTEWNDTAWRDTPAADKFNSIVKQARAELDTGKRQQLYTEAQRLVRDDGGVIVPMFANYIMAASDKLDHDEQVAANWDLDGNKIAERWWFA